MIKLLIKSLLFLILLSCEAIPNKKLSTIVEKSNEIIQKTLKQEPAIITKQESTIPINQEPLSTTNQQPSIIKKKNNRITYLIGDPYFIKGVKYTPQEDYSYNKTGLATFYGKLTHCTLWLHVELLWKNMII